MVEITPSVRRALPTAGHVSSLVSVTETRAAAVMETALWWGEFTHEP